MPAESPPRPTLVIVCMYVCQRAGDRVEELQPRGVDPPSRLYDEGHEVALVPVLRHLDAAVLEYNGTRVLPGKL